MLVHILLSKSGLGNLLSGLMEGLGVPWPGAVVVTAAGTEFPGMQSAAILATVFAITYTLGSALQYAVGRYCRHLFERFLSEKVRTQLDQAIHKYGQAAVLWTRPLAVGNYISIPAGMMRMNPTKFLLYTFVGIWPWAFGMSLAGGVLSQLVTLAADALPLVAAALVVVAVAAGLHKLWRRAQTTN